MIKDNHNIEIFKISDQIEKEILLEDGGVLKVWNIAWGYDFEDEFAHITTNISPAVENADIDFFYTNEIIRIKDLLNRITLYEK